MPICIHSFTQLTPELLSRLGIDALLVDLDNTLVPPHAPLPTTEAARWVESVTRAGIPVVIVSNNEQSRVQRFCEGFDEPVRGLWKAAKPFPHKLRRAMRELGVRPSRTGFLGDQLFTDMLAACLSGSRRILTDPLVAETDRFFRFKRACERLILPKRRYYQ